MNSEAKAACVSVNFETGETLSQIFSGEDVDNPSAYAQAFCESVRDDFPGCVWALVENEGAKAIRVAETLRRMGITPE